MAKRLKIILQDPEYREILRAAHAQRMSISQWVRRALAYATREGSVGDVEKKIEAIRAAAKHECPTSDIGTTLAEIERGYPAGQP